MLMVQPSGPTASTNICDFGSKLRKTGGAEKSWSCFHDDVDGVSISDPHWMLN
jgi:hypothetical protein